MSPAAELSALLSRMATLARTTTVVSGAYAAPARRPGSQHLNAQNSD